MAEHPVKLRETGRNIKSIQKQKMKAEKMSDGEKLNVNCDPCQGQKLLGA